jgi:hypothetical protein
MKPSVESKPKKGTCDSRQVPFLLHRRNLRLQSSPNDIHQIAAIAQRSHQHPRQFTVNPLVHSKTSI